MRYFLILTIYLFLLFIEHIVLISHLLFFSLIFSCFVICFYYFYLFIKTSLLLNMTDIVLVKIIGACMWAWLVIYNGLPFLWFLICYAYMRIYKTPTFEEAAELTIKKEPVAFYIKWLFWFFMFGYKIGDKNFKSKINTPMSPYKVVVYLFCMYVVHAALQVFFAHP